MSPALQLLQQYFAQLAANGVTHLTLDPEVRENLGCLRQHSIDEMKHATAKPFATGSSYAAAAVDALPRASSLPPASMPALEPSVSEAASKAALLSEVARRAELCERARRLGTLRETMVFATGSPDAQIMFIGEAPGAEEEKQREPFVGPAGQTLTKIIQAMGLRRSEVYISNICKFRPKIDDGRNQGSKNRPPTIDEMLACQEFIIEELNIVKPRIIVALGATAATGLGIQGSVGKLRGSMLQWHGTPLVVTYHPSYLLRQEQEDGGGVREKRLVWEDMMRVMEAIGLPISPKQRGYFSKAVK